MKLRHVKFKRIRQEFIACMARFEGCKRIAESEAPLCSTPETSLATRFREILKQMILFATLHIKDKCRFEIIGVRSFKKPVIITTSETYAPMFLT